MSSGFVTETEALEARRVRQEQWELVRTDTQPLEVPEEPYDARPLYTRLEEQKNKKDAEFEEAHKLKNMIRGLDDDEVGFLEMVEQSKASVARQISLEEQREMKEFRERVNTVQDSVERERLQHISGVKQIPVKKVSTSNNTRSMLQGAIRKRKVSDTETDKTDEPAAKNIPTQTQTNGGGETHKETNGHNENKNANGTNQSASIKVPLVGGSMRCIGILPGIGPYKGSSDSECSSDSDDERPNHQVFDLLGRKQDKKESTEKC